MAEGQVAGQAEQDIEADRKDSVDRKTLQEVGIARADRGKPERHGEHRGDEHHHQDEVAARRCPIHGLALHQAPAAEQAPRANKQDDDGDEIDDDLVDAWHDRLDLVHRREGLQYAEQEPG